jgi:ATPase subunit of ABC transporter with duplicated ATPase domains
MPADSVILRFSDVVFEYDHNKRLLDEASFSVRTGSRIALMGQNGAGKSSLFKLITGEAKPTEGTIAITPKDASIAIAKQVIPRDMLELTVREYFETAFSEKKYNLDKLIREVFEVVNVQLPLEKKTERIFRRPASQVITSLCAYPKPGHITARRTYEQFGPGGHRTPYGLFNDV